MQNTIFANNGGCEHVTGNDTDAGGYRLIIPDPEECWTIVRAIAPGENMDITLSNNILTLNALSSAGNTTLRGGGAVTVNIQSNNALELVWSDPVLVCRSDEVLFSIPPFSQVNYPSVPRFSANGNYICLTAPRLLLTSDSSCYIADPPMILPPGVSCRLIVVFDISSNPTTNLWFNIPGNYTGDLYPLCSINSSPLSRSLSWIPGQISISNLSRLILSTPFTLIPNTITYNNLTGGCSWLDNRYLNREVIFVGTLRVNMLVEQPGRCDIFVFWSAVVNGTDTSNIRVICSAPNGVDTFNYNVSRPHVGAMIERYLPNGTVDTVTVRTQGIYLDNGQGLFSYFNTQFNVGMLAVANYTDEFTSVCNIPNQSSLALICYRQDLIGSNPYTMNLKWIPGSILVPIQRIPQGATFVEVIYDSMDGNCSWITNAFNPRITTLEDEVQAIEDELDLKEPLLTIQGDDTNTNGYKVIQNTINVRAMKPGRNVYMTVTDDNITFRGPTRIDEIDDLETTLNSKLNNITVTDNTAGIKYIDFDTSGNPNNLNVNASSLGSTLSAMITTIQTNTSDIAINTNNISINTGSIASINAILPSKISDITVTDNTVGTKYIIYDTLGNPNNLNVNASSLATELNKLPTLAPINNPVFTGKVGINKTTPSYDLEIYDSNNISPYIHVGGGGGAGNTVGLYLSPWHDPVNRPQPSAAILARDNDFSSDILFSTAPPGDPFNSVTEK